MNKLLLLLFILVLLGSCINSKTESTIPTISLEGLWYEKGIVNLSDVAESIDYIPLEKTPECILPGENLMAAQILGDYITVRSPEHPVYVFCLEGKFLFKMGSYGKGPGEFLSARIEYDPVNKVFWILDPSQEKILRFNNQGKFIDENKLRSSAKRIAMGPDGNLYALMLPHRTRAETAEVQIFDNKVKIFDGIPLYQDREPGAGDYASITAFFGFVGGYLHFNEGPYRSGYYLDKNSTWIEAWKLDQGKNALEDDAYYGTGSTSFLTGPSVVNVTESEDYLFIYGRKEGLSKHFVYFKNDMQVKINELLAETEMTMDMWGMFNDIDGGLPFWPNSIPRDNKFLQLNDAMRYIELAEGNLKYYGTDKKVPVSEELKSLCEKLGPDDNPVAMIVRLRK